MNRYYAPQYLNESGFGSFDEWFGIGAAFAAHLRPNGTWATSPAAFEAGVPNGFGVEWCVIERVKNIYPFFYGLFHLFYCEKEMSMNLKFVNTSTQVYSNE